MSDTPFMVIVNSHNSIPSDDFSFLHPTHPSHWYQPNPNAIKPNPVVVPFGPHGPYVPYAPEPDQLWPNVVVTTSGCFLPLNPWTVELKPDSITMQHDMPGVKVEDLTVAITDGKLVATGVRRDLRNGANVLEARIIAATYDVSMYEPASATALLKNGVLIVHMNKREEVKPKTVKVPVTLAE
jgi:hypothetical protein